MLSKDIESLKRSDIRYRLYRMRNEKPIEDDINDLIKEHFESQPGFSGWHEFAIKWDVAGDDPFRVIRRKYTEEEEWNAILRQRTADI